MYWPDEIREPDFEEVGKEIEVRPQEVTMARSLIESMTETFDPDEYRDEYREKLLEVISKKIAGEEIAAVADAQPSSTVVDLMEALKASMDAITAEKGADAEGNGEGSKKRPAARKKKAAAG
jgi:DNA end-binding protein Ku